MELPSLGISNPDVFSSSRKATMGSTSSRAGPEGSWLVDGDAKLKQRTIETKADHVGAKRRDAKLAISEAGRRENSPGHNSEASPDYTFTQDKSKTSAAGHQRQPPDRSRVIFGQPYRASNRKFRSRQQSAPPANSRHPPNSRKPARCQRSSSTHPSRWTLNPSPGSTL